MSFACCRDRPADKKAGRRQSWRFGFSSCAQVNPFCEARLPRMLFWSWRGWQHHQRHALNVVLHGTCTNRTMRACAICGAPLGGCLAEGGASRKPQLLPRVKLPVLLELIYCWSQIESVNQAVHETGASESTVSATYAFLRETASDWMLRRSEHAKIGGPNVIVAVDETFITRKKRNKGGFFGHVTNGNKLIVLGAVELHPQPDGSRKAGKSILLVIPDRKAETIQQVFAARIARGSLIFSDVAGCYLWLNKSPCWKHGAVIHAKGEFSRQDDDGVLVSSNAAEGLFSRCKRFLRSHLVTVRSKDHLGDYLREYLWRTTFIVAEGRHWRSAAFLETLHMLRHVFPTGSNRGALLPIEEGLSTSFAGCHQSPRKKRAGRRYGPGSQESQGGVCGSGVALCTFCCRRLG